MQSISLNGPIKINDGKIVPCSFPEKIKRFFSPSYDKKEIQSVADHIFKTIQNSDQKISYLPLANDFVLQHAQTRNGDKISQIFDRRLSMLFPERQFQHSANTASLAKWLHYGQDSVIYYRHPEFCSFMETSSLLSQIKVTRDILQEIEGEPAIKVNGDWMKWNAFKEQFKVINSEKYKEKFIVDADGNVHTYLDNGKGLQPHHPYRTENTPTSVINEEDYAKVLKKAHTFVRAGEENLTPEELEERNRDRTFILQLVTSQTDGADTRLSNLITKARHPYIRVIIGKDNPSLKTQKGEVYEVGYGWKGKVAAPLMTTQGQFRSPDIWEYLKADEKIVTNIPVTQEEAHAFSKYVTDYHRSEVNLGNPIGFHILTQNCSTFARAAFAAANIQIPSEITLADLVRKISPAWIASTGGLVKKAVAETHNLVKRAVQILPSWIKNPINWVARKVTDVFNRTLEAFMAVVFIPLKLALGDAFGKGGRAFIQLGDRPYNIKPSLMSLKKWFMLPSYKVNLPGILQQWQRKQASTVIYNNPIRLCIVP